MQGTPEVAVLRLGHRPGRDERMTTHVGLTARALGADRVVLAGEGASRRGTASAVPSPSRRPTAPAPSSTAGMVPSST